MDQWIPKGGTATPTDGAFERFLSAAIATIITIIFSWRMVDKLSEEKQHSSSHFRALGSGGVGDDEKEDGSLSSTFSSPSQLSPTASSRIPLPKNKSSSLYNRALPFAPSSSSASLSPSSLSSSSSSSRRQLPTVPADPKLSDYQQQLLQERMSSLRSFNKTVPSPTPTAARGIVYQLTELKPIIRVPVDLPLCGDEDLHNNNNNAGEVYASKNSNSDVTMQESPIFAYSKNTRGSPGNSPIEDELWRSINTINESSGTPGLPGEAIDLLSSGTRDADSMEVEESGASHDRFVKTESAPLSCESKSVPCEIHNDDNGDNGDDDKGYFDESSSARNEGFTKSVSVDKSDVDDNNDDEEDDDELREELREIESAFGITEPFVRGADRNSSRGVIEAAAGSNNSNSNNSGSGSEIFDSSIEDSEELDVVSASQDSNRFLNVSWDSVPVGGDGGGPDSAPFLLREVSEKIRVLNRRRFVKTTDLDDDSVLLPDDEDEFYLTPSSPQHGSSNYRPLGVFSREDDDSLEYYDDDRDNDYDDYRNEYDIQPRELDSDEELFCCSLLETIMEEDSEDLSSTSSSDYDPNSNSRSPRVLRRLLKQQKLHTTTAATPNQPPNIDSNDDENAKLASVTAGDADVSTTVRTSPVHLSPLRHSNLSLLERTAIQSPTQLSPPMNQQPRANTTRTTATEVGFELPTHQENSGDLNTAHLSTHVDKNTTHNTNDFAEDDGGLANPDYHVRDRSPLYNTISPYSSTVTTPTDVAYHDAIPINTSTLPRNNTNNTPDFDRSLLDQYIILSDEEYLDHIRHHGSSVDAVTPRLSRSTGDIDIGDLNLPPFDSNLQPSHSESNSTTAFTTAGRPGERGGVAVAFDDGDSVVRDINSSTAVTRQTDHSVVCSSSNSSGVLSTQSVVSTARSERDVRVKDERENENIGDCGNSFVQTFSTRVEEEDVSNSESDESVQTVIIRKLSSDSSSGAGTNSNNSPAHSDSSVSARLSPSKTTRRPLSDSLVYPSKKPRTEDNFRDRVVSEGGGVPFGDDEDNSIYQGGGEDEILVLTSDGDNKNSYDLRAYQSYANLADFGEVQKPSFGRPAAVTVHSYNINDSPGDTKTSRISPIEEDDYGSDSDSDSYYAGIRVENKPGDTTNIVNQQSVSTPTNNTTTFLSSSPSLDGSQKGTTKPSITSTEDKTETPESSSLEQIKNCDGFEGRILPLPGRSVSDFTATPHDTHTDVGNSSAAVVTRPLTRDNNRDSHSHSGVFGDESGVNSKDNKNRIKLVTSVNAVSSNPFHGNDRRLIVAKMDGGGNQREYRFGKSGYFPGPGAEEEGEDSEYEETEITETFVVPESREKVIQRTLQNVRDMLDKKRSGSSSLEPRDGGDEDMDFDEECQSTCTTTLIDVIGHDAMGFHGDDDERSGYRVAQDAVARTDSELKKKMGFQLGFDDFKLEDYDTESGWPIVRYMEKERAFVDEEGEDVTDCEEEEEREESPGIRKEESDDFRREMEVDDNNDDDDNEDGGEYTSEDIDDGEQVESSRPYHPGDPHRDVDFQNPPGQGFFYPQAVSVQYQPDERFDNKPPSHGVRLEYKEITPDQQRFTIPEYYEAVDVPREQSENFPYVHVENKPYGSYKYDDVPYEEKMNIPEDYIGNIPQGYKHDPDSHYTQWGDDTGNTDQQGDTTPYSKPRSFPAQTPDLTYEDDRMRRDLPQSRPPRDPEADRTVSSQHPVTQTPFHHRPFSPTKHENAENERAHSIEQYAQLVEPGDVLSPTVHVPDSPVIQFSSSDHFPRRLSERTPVCVVENVTKEESVNLEAGANVSAPSQKNPRGNYDSSSESSDSRGKPDEGFDSFLRGVPDFRKKDDGGYEEFVRNISDIDEIPFGVDEYGNPTPVTITDSNLQTPVSDGILSGNLTSPRKIPGVFVFPKENTTPQSKIHSSPSYVDQPVGAMDEGNDEPVPQSAVNVEDLPKMGVARRSSSYSLYNESTGNVLNASFEESETSGFMLEKYNSEPGLNRCKSNEALSRSRSREGISDSPRSIGDELSCDSPIGELGKGAGPSVSPSSKLLHSARNPGVSTEPSLDVVMEAANVSPQLSPLLPPTTTTPTTSSSSAPVVTSPSSQPDPNQDSPQSQGSPVRWTRLIVGSSFVPSSEDEPELVPHTISDTKTKPPTMEPVIVELPQERTRRKELPIFSADTPESRLHQSPPSKRQMFFTPSDQAKLIGGPKIKPILSRELNRPPPSLLHTEPSDTRYLTNKSSSSSSSEEEEEEEEDDDEEDEKEQLSSNNNTNTLPVEVEDEMNKVDQLKASSAPTSNINIPPPIGQLRNFSYSLESAEDVYPSDLSSTSAITSPHMSSDSASALEVPNTSGSAPRYSPLSPSSSIITHRLQSPSSMQGTPWAHAQFIKGTPKKPTSMKEIKKKYHSHSRPYKSVLTQEPASPSPRPAPFAPPESMVTPSRLKILYSRNKFLSEQNLQSDSIAGEFQAHKEALLSANAPAKERRYTSNTPVMNKSRFNSQDQLQRLKDMINSKERGKSESALHECLHDNCILSEHGRREIIDKTLSIDNMHADLFQNFRRLASEGDAGAYEDAFFPESSSDLYDLTFPTQDAYSLDRPASMSELRHASDYSTISGAVPEVFESTPSRNSSGKGRFAGHRQYKKSKSLCTLETDLDDDDNFGTSPIEDGMKRVPSVHELRISKSLQKLNVPDWYSRSSLSKSGSCLLKYGSSSTMSSFQFSPSLLSSPCTTPSGSSNVVIKTRVVPTTSARSLRSPRFPVSKSAPTTPSFLDQDKDKARVNVKLPSDKLRSQEKGKGLMPIPIVPFDKIRAMFEKKTPVKKETTSPSISSPPTSPTSSSTIQPSYTSPQHAEPPKTLSFNGVHEHEEDDMIVPRIIVSPTEPHVKSILKKKPVQGKRYSDIQETAEPVDEPVDEPVIIKPIATHPTESTPARAQGKPPPIPTSSVPERPVKRHVGIAVENKPRLDPVLTEDSLPPIDGNIDKPSSPIRMIDESFSSDNGKREIKPEPKKEEPTPTPPVAKPRGFKFFKSFRSSSSSSSEDVKESKGKKSPSGQKSPSKSQSPNSSYDSSGFPASPTRKIETPEVITPAVPAPHPAETRVSNQPTDSTSHPAPESKTVRLEEAPVLRPPPPLPSSSKSTSKPLPVNHQQPSSKHSSKETNLDDIQETIQPPVDSKPVSAPAPAEEPPKPEKKRWFPKPKGFRSSKPANDPTEPKRAAAKEITEPPALDKPNAFEVHEIEYEPRRLQSSRSSGLDDSVVSEKSVDSRRTWQPDSSRSRQNSRPSDLSVPARKSSIESDNSFSRDLDRVSDRALAGDFDRGSGRSHNLDKRPTNDSRGRDRGARPIDLDHRSPVSPERRDIPKDFDRREPVRDADGRRDFDRGEPARASERRERPIDFDRREPARASDRPRTTDRRELPRDVDSSRSNARDNENRRSTDLDRSINSIGSVPRSGSRDPLTRDNPRPSARSSGSYSDVMDTSRSSGRWQPKPKDSRSSASPARQDTNSNGAPSAYRFPVEGSAFSATKPNTPAGLNTPPVTSKVNHDVTPSSPSEKSDKSVRGECAND